MYNSLQPILPIQTLNEQSDYDLNSTFGLLEFECKAITLSNFYFKVNNFLDFNSLINSNYLILNPYLFIDINNIILEQDIFNSLSLISIINILNRNTMSIIIGDTILKKILAHIFNE
jgi:hypothetical protein